MAFASIIAGALLILAGAYLALAGTIAVVVGVQIPVPPALVRPIAALVAVGGLALYSAGGVLLAAQLPALP